MIRFACPACGKIFSAPVDAAGKTGTCKQCHAAVEVPQAPAAPLRPLKGIPLAADGPPPQADRRQEPLSLDDPSPVPRRPRRLDLDGYAEEEGDEGQCGDDPVEKYRRRRRRRRAARWLVLATPVVLAGVAVTTSLTVGWPFAALHRRLPAEYRRPVTLDEVVARLLAAGVVAESERIPAGHPEFLNRPGYALLVKVPGTGRPSPCVLVGFESEKDVEGVVRLGQMAVAGQKGLENQEMFAYHNFLFSGDARAVAQIKAALR